MKKLDYYLSSVYTEFDTRKEHLNVIIGKEKDVLGIKCLPLNLSWTLSIFGILPPEQDNGVGLIKNKNGEIYFNYNYITETHVEVTKSVEYDDIRVNDTFEYKEILVSGPSNETINLESDWTKIDDYKQGEPLFGWNEKIILKKGSLPFITDDIVTTYGILHFNILLIWYPYRGKVKFLNEEFTSSKINKIAFDLLNDDKVTVNPEHKRFENAISLLTGFSPVSVPSLTRKAITPNPKMWEIRDKILKEHKGEIDDPNLAIKIKNAQMEEDSKYLKGDDSEGFLFTDKARGMVRIRTLGTFGAEPDYDDESKVKVIIPSLTEGLSIEHLPTLINSGRNKSINRGGNTALAGVTVKRSNRNNQNTTIVDRDCGSTQGLRIWINSLNYNSYIGRYEVGKNKPIEKDELKSKMGQIMYIRSPIKCLADESSTTYCKICMGNVIGNSKLGANALATEFYSVLLGVFMKLVHTTELTTGRYNYREQIT